MRTTVRLKYKVIFFDLGDTLIKNKHWLPGTWQLVQLLFKENVRLGVISNTGELTRKDLVTMLPDNFSWNYFEDELIILSGEVKVEKPSPEIFEQAIAKSKCDPKECLFCTENVLDTLVAQQLGLHTYRVQSPPNSDTWNIPTILSDLITIFQHKL
jgi:FMN phosphatase YigB (HAD superfamily)